MLKFSMAELARVKLEMLSDRLSLKIGAETLYSQPQPLLLLSYLALEGETLRSELTQLFWAHIADSSRARLSEVIRLLKKLELEPAIIRTEPSTNPHDSYLVTEVKSDVADLSRAIDEDDVEKILQLYQRPLLWQMETRRRLPLNDGELSEWLKSSRENLANKTRGAVLRAAERAAMQEKYTRAAHLAQKAWRHIITETTALSAEEYQRIQRLLLAHSATFDLTIRKEAEGHKLQVDFAPDRSHARASLSTVSNLPKIHSPLIGREKIHAEITGYLRGKGRCVNLVGMAGMGKSKLALHIARDLWGYYCCRDGTFVVWLQDIKERDAALSMIAQSLNLKAKHLPAIIAALKDKGMLLLLDNLEDILADDEQMVDDLHTLLEECPSLRILLTSRSKLGREWEKYYQLEGLHYQDMGMSILSSAAGTLWLKQGISRPQPEDYPALQDIFTFSQGNPLALKLAARCSESQSIQAIAREFKRQLQTVTLRYGKLNDFNIQHQSLVIAFENSWQQLSSLEQTHYLPLALFASSICPEMLQASFAPAPESLSKFCQRSLLRWQSDTKRYHLHPLLRQFALEKLEQSPHKQQWQEKYHHYFSQQLLVVICGTPIERNHAPQRLALELPNIAKAWQWQLEQANYEFLDKGAHALEQLYDLLGQASVGKTLLQRAEQTLAQHLEIEPRNSSQQRAYVNILASLAWLCKQSAQYKEAAALAERARELAQSWQHERALSTALNTLGAVYDMCGQFSKARKYVMESLQQKQGGSSDYANVLSNLAQIDMQLGDYQSAQQRLQQALAIFERKKRYLKIVQCHFKLARLAFLQQENATQIQEKFHQVARLAQQHHTYVWRDRCYFYQGYLACLEQNYELAKDYSYKLSKLAQASLPRKLEKLLLDIKIQLQYPSHAISISPLLQQALKLAKNTHNLISLFHVLALKLEYYQQQQHNTQHLDRFLLLNQKRIPHYIQEEIYAG